MTSQTTPQADRLKAEGNALFVRNDFSGAYKKYTEALKSDDQNPILYSNRAACSLGLKRYLNASVDATKATDIDPGYARAWGRLAAARMGLNRIDEAIDAWKSAVGAMQKDKLTPAEKKQRDQYNSELATAKAKFEDLKANPKQPEGMTTVRSSEIEKLPWRRAMTLLPGLNASGTWDSSAWVIERAYTTWEEAVNALKEGRMQQTPAGPAYVGRCGVIAMFTNALIEDARVFHMTDGNLVSMYNRQMELEATTNRAWSESSPGEVIQEAPERLKAEGWESVRLALSTTVRGWMMRAFIEYVFDINVETAVDFYTSALEVLRWGAESWRDVPFGEKGNIFQPTFMRGVKCLRLEALLKACNQKPEKYSHEELLTAADELISELADAPTQPPVPDPAFFLSFFRYPVGQAHSVRGFCLLEKAKRLRKANGGALTADITMQYLRASAEYLRAAEFYPKDDENHAWYLHCAYHAQFDGGTTPGRLMPLLDMLKESVPLMRKIWERTPEQADSRSRALEADLKARERLRRALDNKEVELDSVVINKYPGV